jgi:hypothetical protein
MKRFKNIGKKVKNIWVKYVKEPILRTYKKNKEKRELNRKIANIREDFEERFKIKIKDVKELMYHEKVSTTNNPFERQVFLNQELEKAKKLLSDPKNVNNHVFFYEPEMVEIHNESTYLLTKDLNEIKRIDFENSIAELRKKKRELVRETKEQEATRLKFDKWKELSQKKPIIIVSNSREGIYDEDYGKDFEKSMFSRDIK